MNASTSLTRSIAVGLAILVAPIALSLVSSSASASISDCAIDYVVDGRLDRLDVEAFLAYERVGSSIADLNGDQSVDESDLETFHDYYTSPTCPWKGDYQYDREINQADAILFQVLFAAGSLRADLNNDHLLGPIDWSLFVAGFDTSY